MAMPTYKACYKDWEEVAEGLRAALDSGEVPQEEVLGVMNCLEAAQAEITAIEDQQLEASEQAYKPVTAEIKTAKESLENVKEEIDTIVTMADQAEKMLALLTRLIPLLA